jgi:hypothetical protein
MRFRPLLPPAAAWLAGLLVAFYPVLLTGLARTPGDLGDARLVNFLLEHDWRWLTGRAGHGDLWSPPVFYPVAHTAAYSDLLLAALPFYAPWRLLGLAPDTAFQLFLLTAVSLNFWSAHAYFARCLRLPPLPAAAAAFLFAFASSRLVQLRHAQLQVHVYTVVVLYAAHRLVEAAAPERFGRTSRLPGWSWAVLLPVAAVAQLFAGFYLGWFLGLGLLLVAAWALALPSCRPCLLGTLCRWWPALLAGTLPATAAAAWLASHYLAAQRQVGAFPADALAGTPPVPLWWLNRGPDAWLSVTRLLVRLGWLRHDPWPPEEFALGVGPLTTLLALAGLWRGRRLPLAGLALAATLTTLLLFTTLWPGDPATGRLPESAYRRLILPVVPGAGAVRVQGRVGLVLLLPLGLGLALALRRLRPAWLAVCCLVCLLEQGQFAVTFDKGESRRRVAAVADQVPPRATAFFAVRVGKPTHPSCAAQIDAMWAALETGVPTVNGYSGSRPPGWDLADNEVGSPGEEERLEEALRRWLRANGVADEEVARVRVAAPPAAPSFDSSVTSSFFTILRVAFLRAIVAPVPREETIHPPQGKRTGRAPRSGRGPAAVAAQVQGGTPWFAASEGAFGLAFCCWRWCGSVRRRRRCGPTACTCCRTPATPGAAPAPRARRPAPPTERRPTALRPT